MTKRSRGRPPGRTAQGEATRALLYDTAIRLFSERGYEATTLRAIATEAGVSPGLMYRYFPSKQAVVMELYDELTTGFVEQAAAIGAGTWFDRGIDAVQTSLESLSAHRTVLRGVLPLMLADDETGLLSPGGEISRIRVQQVFLDMVEGASNAPGDLSQAVGRLLYLIQLMIILWWLLDRTEDQRATEGLLRWIRGLRGAVSAAMWLPGAAATIRGLDELATEALYA